VCAPQEVGQPGQDAEQLGEVELSFAGGTERFLARATEPVEVDAAVLVVGEMPGRVVDVERWTRLPGL